MTKLLNKAHQWCAYFIIKISTVAHVTNFIIYYFFRNCKLQDQNAIL